MKTILAITGSRKNKEKFISVAKKLRSTWIFRTIFINKNETNILSEESRDIASEYLGNENVLNILLTIDKFLKNDVELLVISEPDNKQFIEKLKETYGIYCLKLANIGEELSNTHDCTIVVNTDFENSIRKTLDILKKDK